MRGNKKIMNHFIMKAREYKREIICIILGLVWLFLFGKVQLANMVNWFNSDWAADLIFARQCAVEGRGISHNLCYTTEFKFLDLQLIKALFFHVLDSWVKINAWGNTVAFFILYLSSIFLLKKLELNGSGILFFCAIAFIVPFSASYFEIALVAGFYTIKIIVEILFLGLFYAFLKTKKRNWRIGLAVCAAVLSIFSGIGGIRLTLLLYIPLVAACIVNWIMEVKDNEIGANKWREAINGKAFRPMVWSLFYLLFDGIGYVLNVKYFARVYQFQGSDKVFWGDIYGVNLFDRLGDRFAGIANTLGYYGNINVFSLEGIKNLLALAVMVVSVYCHVHIIKNWKKYPAVQINMTLFSAIAIVANGFIFTITDYSSSRYWVPVLVFSIPVIGIYLNGAVEKLIDNIFCIVITIICVGFLALGCFQTTKSVLHSKGNEHRQASIEFLEDNGYTFGYSTYWNANVVTAISNGRVEVASIYSPETMDYYLWGTTKDYYKEGYHDGKCFLLLTLEEREAYKEGSVLSNGQEIYRDDYFVIYSYDSVDTLLGLAGRPYLVDG